MALAHAGKISLYFAKPHGFSAFYGLFLSKKGMYDAAPMRQLLLFLDQPATPSQETATFGKSEHRALKTSRFDADIANLQSFLSLSRNTDDTVEITLNRACASVEQDAWIIHAIFQDIEKAYYRIKTVLATRDGTVVEE